VKYVDETTLLLIFPAIGTNYIRFTVTLLQQIKEIVAM
jgi:hypothetical protein